MATIFTKIINGEIPCYKVAESENYLAFLDISPLKYGHVLVVPKIEVDYIFDLNDQQLSGLMLFSKRVAKGMKAVLDYERIGIAVIGLEVPHTHIHLIPINSVSDINFANPKQSFSEEQMQDIAAKINAAI